MSDKQVQEEPRPVFHASIEAAQHGKKGLEKFLAFAQAAGADGVQPTCGMLEDEEGHFRDPDSIKQLLGDHTLKLDGISGHTEFWTHTGAWTGTCGTMPFLRSDLKQAPPAQIEAEMQSRILDLLDLCAALGAKILPMFWGPAYGIEVASGFPWPFFDCPDYDLIKAGNVRFVQKTAKIRNKARSLGIYLAHEIHAGTAAQCAEDFLHLVEICDGDPCLTVNADPSHCWDGEDMETRFLRVAQHVYGCHVKNHHVVRGRSRRSMNANWKLRGMYFTDLPSGDLSMMRYVELMLAIGYAMRYCSVMGTMTAPLVAEAESDFRDLNDTAANGIAYIKRELCYPVSVESFQAGMGAPQA